MEYVTLYYCAFHFTLVLSPDDNNTNILNVCFSRCGNSINIDSAAPKNCHECQTACKVVSGGQQILLWQKNAIKTITSKILYSRYFTKMVLV